MRCEHCYKPITDKYIISDQKNYHEKCYQEIAPKCCFCHRVIDGEYFIDPQQGNICKKCFHPDLQCFSCEKQMSAQTALILSDNRKICQQCYSTAQFDMPRNIIQQIKNIFSQWGACITKPIIFETTDLASLMNFQGISSQTVTGRCITSFLDKQAKKHRILILFGLAKEHFMAILAHELFHAWLHENPKKTKNLSNNDVEWLCDFIAYHVLQEIHDNSIWLRNLKQSMSSYNSHFNARFSCLSPQEIIN